MLFFGGTVLRELREDLPAEASDCRRIVEGDSRRIYCWLKYGSHFSQTRLVSSFDEGCGPRDASPCRARFSRSRSRVAAWRALLEAACLQMLAEDTPISVPAAFRQVGLSRTPRLRVSRLGLATVERYATLQGQGMRERILEGFRAGMTPRELARALCVSSALVRQVPADRPKCHCGANSGFRTEQEGAPWAQLEASPTATFAMHAQQWNQGHGTTMHRSTMCDAIHRLGWTPVQGRWESPSRPPDRR